MKRMCVPKCIFLFPIAVLCASLLACGGGANSALAPMASVASTQNPLVAQYTVASGCAGQAMVEFGPDTSYGKSTSWYPVLGGYQKTNILVAGMTASTTYHMRSLVECADQAAASADLTFATGALPSSLPFPQLQVSRPITPGLATPPENPGIELLDLIAPTSNMMQAFATDRDGNPIWYYDVGQGYYPFTVKPLSNGHILLNVVSPTLSILREVDLAGNTIREMDINAFQQKVQSAGYDFVPAGFHHDLLPLDNGHLLILVDCSKSFTDLPGYPGTIAVTGDVVVDLDSNWNPDWYWNSFDYLDINRHLEGLPDWTHSNALVYSPDDGNILVSMRHQSWVLKLDYQNGAGSGRVLWRLGYQGDFALAQGGDPSLWFSFQHFPSMISHNGAQTTLAIWDNGDNRVLNSNGEVCIDPRLGGIYPSCYSRATVFQIDESAMVANLLWADPLQYFGVWGGSINQLANGNIEFDLNDPAIPPSANVASEVQEVTQTSTPQVVWKMDIPVPTYAYRTYRIPSLYPGVTWP
jgi:arylsulfate sulfotransferase